MTKLTPRMVNRLRQMVGYLTRCPGGASFLSWAYFLLTRSRAGKAVRIFWEGKSWYRVEPKILIPLGPFFPLGTGIARYGQPNGEEIFGPRRGWWFRHYQPLEGDTILDIGAGMGEDTWVFSCAVGQSGRVIAVEAHPTTYQILKDFIRYNHLTNVAPYFGAASSNSGEAIITDLPMSDWQLNSVSLGANIAPVGGHRVPTFRLDDLAAIKGISKFSFMKMNIEGAETLALEGARSLLSKTSRICVCCLDFLGPSTATKTDVCRLLQAAGFDLFFTGTESPPYERDFVYGKK